jgi:hypothetical protein
VRNGVRLAGLAFAVVESAGQSDKSTDRRAVARAPEIGRARLISDIFEHSGDFAVFDFPESLPAELEIVALLVNRITAAPVNHNSFFDARD